MKKPINLDEYPLDIFKDPVCNEYLKLVSLDTEKNMVSLSTDDIIKYFICRVSDIGIATRLNRKWADWCEKMIIKNIASFTRNQIKHIKEKPSIFYQETSLNSILLYSCAESLYENRINNWTFMPNVLKATWKGLKQWSLDTCFEEFDKQAKPIKDRYNYFFIVYHLAFLLHTYKILDKDMESQISTLIKQILQCAYSKKDIDTYHFKHLFENDEELTMLEAKRRYRERIWKLMDNYKNENGYEVLSVYLERQLKRS